MLLDGGDVINRFSATEADWGEQNEVLRREKDIRSPRTSSTATYQPRASTVAHRAENLISPGENSIGSPRTNLAVIYQPQASTVAHRKDNQVSPGETGIGQPRTIQGVANLIALAAIPPPTRRPPQLISGADLLAVTEAPAAVNHHALPMYSIYEDIKGAEAKVQDAFELVMNRRHRFMGFYASQYGYQLNPALRARGAPAPQGAYFAFAHHCMINTLLEAWWERLGVAQDGWMKYSKKTSTRAVLEIREILEQGDVEMGIPVVVLAGMKPKWFDKVRQAKWWFTSIDLAMDFLSAYGIGENRFGSGEFGVEVLQYTNPQRKCSNTNHDQGLDAYEDATKWLPDVFPPVKPCGCYEYKLLMKTIGSARKPPEPKSDRIIRYNNDLLVKGWIETNRRAGIRLQGNWPTDTDATKNKPVVWRWVGALPRCGFTWERKGTGGLEIRLGRSDLKGRLRTCCEEQGMVDGILDRSALEAS